MSKDLIVYVCGCMEDIGSNGAVVYSDVELGSVCDACSQAVRAVNITTLERIKKGASDLVELASSLPDLGYVHKDTMEPVQYSEDGPLRQLIDSLEADHE